MTAYLASRRSVITSDALTPEKKQVNVLTVWHQCSTKMILVNCIISFYAYSFLFGGGRENDVFCGFCEVKKYFKLEIRTCFILPYPRHQFFRGKMIYRQGQYDVMYQTRATAFLSGYVIQTPRREWKIRHTADHFFYEIRGFWIADETLSRVFDISSQSKQKLRRKRRSDIVKIYAN